MATSFSVGVLGLGIIGSRVANNLRQKGFNVSVWNRTPKTEPGFVGSPAELAKHAEIIQIFVSNDAAVRETISALKPALTERHLLLLHSTISPETSRAVQAEVKATQTHVVDAPFTGSRAAAENGQLTYYLAGDPADIERARPVLEASSKTMLFFDRFGDASIVKIATNLISGAIVEALSEAVALVEASGINLTKFAEAIQFNACRSGVGDLKLPGILHRDFRPNFSLKNMLKDSRLALQLAEKASLSLPVTQAVSQMLAKGDAAGLGDQDYAVVSELLRKKPSTD
jgi:3-hydroxyisobutyrate dehydrogenase-like beta-hydroxyacid dehydrogenase